MGEHVNEPAYPALVLRRGEDARLRAGHLWVFANEVDVERTPLTGFQPGEPCAVLDAAGRAIGVGYVNPHSLICARLMARGLRSPLDRSLLVHRIKVALGLRERLRDKPYYRLLYGESDGVPGMVVDRFGDVLVAQSTTAGIDNLRQEAEEALVKVLKPRALVWKNDSALRQLEGLEANVETAFGDPAGTLVEEAGLRFAVDPLAGQKTGWFYDQHDNRNRVMPLLRDARVLDLFSYVGAWSLRSAAAGASEVVAVDSSAAALKALAANATSNELTDRIQTHQADVPDFLRAAREERQRFDVAIVDPPAYIKRRKDFVQGRRAYRRLNELAMRVLSRDGLLVSCSCSHHMPESVLLAEIQKAARHIDRQVQVLARLQQAADHPVHPAIPETSYLKGFVCRVLHA